MARFTARHTIASVILPAIVLAGSGCTKPEQEMSQVERGKYLVMVGGCNDCHTPKIWTPAGPVLDTTRHSHVTRNHLPLS